MPIARLRFLPCFVAALTALALPAHADEHAEVDRLVRSGKWAEASQRADQYLSNQPRDAHMRFLKGLAVAEQGKSVEAAAIFTKLTQDFPALPEPYNNLAVLYSKQGQYDQARRTLEAAIRAHPGYATAHENLGDVYAKLAAQAYAKALQLDGNNAAKLEPKLAMVRELLAPRPGAIAPAQVKPVSQTLPARKPTPAP